MFDSSYEERVLFDSAVGNNTYSSTSSPIRSSQISDKRKEKTGNPSALKTKELHEIIHKKVTKKTHTYTSPQEGDGTIKRCIELFNKGADPNILIQLEKLLREQEEYQKYYNYYTEKFLPALKAEITNSKKLKPEKIKEIEGIINGIISKSSDKGNATEPFNKQSFSSEVPNFTNSDMTPQEEDSVGKGVSGVGTPGKYNTLRSSGHNSASAFPTLEQSQLNGSFSQSCVENEDPSTTADAVEVPSDANTSKLSSGNDSDSGIDSPRKSEESSRSPVSSRRSSLTLVTSTSSEESVSSKSNPTKEDNGLRPEDEGKTKLAHPNKTSPKRPSDCVISVTGSKVKGTMQPNNYKNNSKIKQLNNKNLHVALVTSFALLAIGCIVAGAITSGLVGAGLFVVAAVFATAAAVELCLNFLSSKLTSISVSPLVDNKELAAW